ncbi:MAG: hypothetical protein MR536_03610 [Prevotella sp.]|nr:hypothetical protein [Prevotella sp.]MDD7462100.1 hypothetical protein [Prevotellaceae bacterium]MDY3364735.1 hypothetical protein [Prevotella sp.]MDY3851639.1 hypothetical protein [Prevotella sp.]
MKISINWKRWLVFLVVSAGLLYLTESVWMAAGIFLLLFVADYVIFDWWETQQIKKAREKENVHNQNAKDLTE